MKNRVLSSIKGLSNKWKVALLLSFSLIVIALMSQGQDYDLPKKVDYNYDILPILSQNCYLCHGPDSTSRKANLRLDLAETAYAKNSNGKRAIFKGNANRSLLIKHISSTDPEVQMPPPETKKQLTGRQIALLKKWINQGAEWKPYWAFIKPLKPEIPTPIEDNSSKSIDYLIQKEQNKHQLISAKHASKNELIRRTSFLLTGLPPTPEEVQEFLNNDQPDASEAMIDQYLGSSHYGERWARHWMDLVRYAEHQGHEFDFPINGAWQYRDYLIRAFNQDVPYNLFVKEHLAGDMIKEARLNTEDGFNESILGTGYFSLGEGKHSPVSLKGEELDRIDNMIDVTSRTFQALTVSCARCHDHKFDPIPTTDYYAMYGMMESSRATVLPAKTTNDHKILANRLQKIKIQIQEEEGRLMSSKEIDLEKGYINRQTQVATIQKTDDKYEIIGDFSNGKWGDWFTNGLAFQENTAKTFVSSRDLSAGIQGTLHSPYFTINHDSILIVAKGFNGSVRIIVDNFQLIQNPLWGSFSQTVNSEEWKSYTFDLSMVKGHKAYIQFIPGTFDRHKFNISKNDYIDISYAVAFNDVVPEFFRPNAYKNSINRKPKNSHPTRAQTEAHRLLISERDSISSLLYNQNHFVGMVEGDAVFSPVFIRGDFNQQSVNKVPRKFLESIKAGPYSFPQTGSGRMAWAESVADPLNPLTARVIVNRIWHHIFGTGIVASVDNFGIQGKLPSHPDLLDYLAVHFMENGWSIKSLIKEILMTETFQQSSVSDPDQIIIDPENKYLHHFPLRRLEAEGVRDAMLAVSGSLNDSMYGEPVPIHLTEFMTGRGRPSKSGPLDGNGRRSIYTSVRRNFLSPLMSVFDTPAPFSTFGRRNITNVPAQSLSLMNDPFVYDQAVKWATNLSDHGYSEEEKVNRIYENAFARTPSPEELSAAIAMIKKLSQSESTTQNENESDIEIWANYCHTIFNMKEFIHLP